MPIYILSYSECGNSLQTMNLSSQNKVRLVVTNKKTPQHFTRCDIIWAYLSKLSKTPCTQF